MKYELYLRGLLQVGTETFFSCESKQSPFAVVFEDDLEVGYFYACDRSNDDEGKILDALHIYNVKDVIDKDQLSEIKIGWSVNGDKAVLLINDYPHAIFDFESRRGFCRSNFPPPAEDGWCTNDHKWDENALSLFA